MLHAAAAPTVSEGEHGAGAGEQRKSHAEDMLAGKLSFTVLAIGDSNLLLDRQTTSARDCNKVGQALDVRLAEVPHPLWLRPPWPQEHPAEQRAVAGSSGDGACTLAARQTSAQGWRRWSHGSRGSGPLCPPGRRRPPPS